MTEKDPAEDVLSYLDRMLGEVIKKCDELSRSSPDREYLDCVRKGSRKILVYTSRKIQRHLMSMLGDIEAQKRFISALSKGIPEVIKRNENVVSEFISPPEDIDEIDLFSDEDEDIDLEPALPIIESFEKFINDYIRKIRERLEATSNSPTRSKEINILLSANVAKILADSFVALVPSDKDIIGQSLSDVYSKISESLPTVENLREEMIFFDHDTSLVDMSEIFGGKKPSKKKSKKEKDKIDLFERSLVFDQVYRDH